MVRSTVVRLRSWYGLGLMGYSVRMRLRNLKNNQVVCEDLKICESFLDRFLGLINPRNPRNLMLKTRFGIHTFFLRDSIDVLILDEKNQVVKLRQRLLPNKLFFWNPKYIKVIELEAGSVLKYRIGMGDTLSIN